MSISIKIHDTDLVAQTCVVTIKDNDVTVIDKKNIGLQLDENGAFDTNYIIQDAKLRIKDIRLANTENDVVVTGHPSPVLFTGE